MVKRVVGVHIDLGTLEVYHSGVCPRSTIHYPNLTSV